MPEGPEVFIMAQYLRGKLGFNAVLNSVIIHGKSEVVHEAVDSRVTRVITKGKRAVINLENGMGILLAFALEGCLSYFVDDERVTTPDASKIATMVFSTKSLGSTLHEPPETNSEHDGKFGSAEHDGTFPGKFGSAEHDGTLTIVLSDIMRFALSAYTNSRTIIDELLPAGFDPLHTTQGMNEWLELCKEHQGQLVANFLTNQNFIAGIGNKYRSEVMHVAQIFPSSKVKDLAKNQLEILLISIGRILNAASRGEYVLAVHGRKVAMPSGQAVRKVEVAKGVHIWSVAAPDVQGST